MVGTPANRYMELQYKEGKVIKAMAMLCPFVGAARGKL
jgi:hypothetical protein